MQVKSETTATAAPLVITATLPPTLTPLPSETPLPPAPQPTVTPVEGTTSTQLNVRAEPSTASQVLGIMPANTKVAITGTDPGGNWWQIIYSAGVDGKGWITAQYVEIANKPEVPVIGGSQENPNAENSAVVIQQLNIRSGPGTGFDSLGILNANDVVTLTGRNSAGSWLQIRFEGGSLGSGWVNAGFVKTDDVEALPIVADSGEVLGTGTPMDTPLPPTPTVVAAPMDFDSSDAPQKTVIFDRAGTNALIYNGNVSAPNGDTEDWIAITPFDDVVYARIECSDNNLVRASLIGSDIDLLCNDALRSIPVQGGKVFLVHIQAISSSDSLEYANYILTIKASP